MVIFIDVRLAGCAVRKLSITNHSSVAIALFVLLHGVRMPACGSIETYISIVATKALMHLMTWRAVTENTGIAIGRRLCCQ